MSTTSGIFVWSANTCVRNLYEIDSVSNKENRLPIPAPARLPE